MGVDYYKFYCENLRKIEKGIELIQRDLRSYIARENKDGEFLYTRLLSLTLVIWAETRIYKVVYEENAFSIDERKAIIEAPTLEAKWITALNISICKAYHLSPINDSEVISQKLSFTPRERYKELIRIINIYLARLIQIRNKLAHGQWFYAFNTDHTKVSPDITKLIRNDTIIDYQLGMKMLLGIAYLIHDLAVSPPTFERDFDNNYKFIDKHINNSHNRRYDEYKTTLINRYKRGLLKRKLSDS
jgi:hypothetical protein